MPPIHPSAHLDGIKAVNDAIQNLASSGGTLKPGDQRLLDELQTQTAALAAQCPIAEVKAINDGVIRLNAAAKPLGAAQAQQVLDLAYNSAVLTYWAGQPNAVNQAEALKTYRGEPRRIVGPATRPAIPAATATASPVVVPMSASKAARIAAAQAASPPAAATPAPVKPAAK